VFCVCGVVVERPKGLSCLCVTCVVYAGQVVIHYIRHSRNVRQLQPPYGRNMSRTETFIACLKGPEMCISWIGTKAGGVRGPALLSQTTPSATLDCVLSYIKRMRPLTSVMIYMWRCTQPLIRHYPCIIDGSPDSYDFAVYVDRAR
jgi:hypothetical protein